MTLRFQRLGLPERELYAKWFSDPELNRRVSAPTEQWLRHVNTEGNFAWLVYEGPEAVGQVQLDTCSDQTGSVDLVVNPALRGRGYGSRILANFLSRDEAACLREIEAWIEADNAASLRCFQKAGFAAQRSEPDENGLIVYAYT